MSQIEFDLLPDFLIESEEHLQEMESLLLQLSSDPGNTELLNEVFRPVHSLKGGAQYIGLKQISELTHRAEDLLDLLRQGKLDSSSSMIELMFEVRDLIVVLVEELSSSQSEQSSVAELVARLSKEIEKAGGGLGQQYDGDANQEGREEEIVSDSVVAEFEEENDTELFSIFLNNLRTGLASVQEKIIHFDEAEPQKTLEECAELVAKLQSATNYMGYSDFSQMYSDWQQEIEKAIQAVSSGEAVSIEFMREKLKQAFEFLPEQDDGSDQEAQEPSVNAALIPEFVARNKGKLSQAETLLNKLTEDINDAPIYAQLITIYEDIRAGAAVLQTERLGEAASGLRSALHSMQTQEKLRSHSMLEVVHELANRLLVLIEEIERSQTESTPIDDLLQRIEHIRNHAGQEPSAREEPVSPMPYAEENDQELFEIYIKNLQRSIDKLDQHIASLEQATDRGPVYQDCVVLLKKMLSATRYMDYEELVDIFENWLTEVHSNIYSLKQGEPVEDGFMLRHLAAILDKLPQLTSSSAAESGSDGIIAELLPGFLDEAEEIFSGLQDSLSMLMPDSGELPSVEEAISQIDTLRTAAGFIEAARITELATAMEQLLLLLASEDGQNIAEELIELVLKINSCIGNLIEELESSGTQSIDIEELIQAAERYLKVADDESSRPAADERQSKQIETKPAPAREPGDTAEAYREEYDQELFSIYLKNLAHGLESIHAIAQTLSNSSDPDQELAACSLTLQKLQNSANYMDYRELKLVYENFLEEIEINEQVAKSGERVTGEFIYSYLKKIAAFFPQLELHFDEPVSDSSADQQAVLHYIENLRNQIDQLRANMQDLLTPSDHNQLINRCAESIRDLEAAADRMSLAELMELYEKWLEDNIRAVREALAKGESVPDNFMQSPIKDKKNKVEPAPDEEQEPVPKADEHGDLYKKLVDALDGSAAGEAIEKQQTLHDVMANMLSQPEAESEAANDRVVSPDKAAEAPSKQLTSEEATEAAMPSERTDKNSVRKQASDSLLKKNVRVDAEKIDTLINQVGELVVDRSYFFQLFNEMRNLQKHMKDELGYDQKELKKVRTFSYKLGEAIASLSRTSNDIQEGVMRVRMLPISQLFNRYPRLVHDLTRNSDKSVKLEVRGEETELDKMVVEELSDPLIHIIRNAIDHGIEDSKTRRSKGKSESGNLVLEAYQEGNQIIIEVLDDGRGIDPEVMKAKALEKGFISQEEASRMTPQDCVRLITTAGFSTAKQVTNTSGRGVGMDVVKENIEKLNGALEIESKPGEGTKIQLRIPLTLAIIPAHMIMVGKSMFTIPLANVEETLRIMQDETSIVEGMEVVLLRGKTMPIVRLSDLFKIQSSNVHKAQMFIIVVNTGMRKFGLVVDELLGQEEVVIKPLVDYLQERSGFSGATIIGDGRISLILDVKEIENMTIGRQIARQKSFAAARSSGNGSATAAAM